MACGFGEQSPAGLACNVCLPGQQPTADATCDSADWAGTAAACRESKGTCAGADPDVPGTATKAACDAAATTCDGADWSGTQTECLESVGTCAGADPGVPGTATKAACDAAATTPGTFTSTATFAAATAGTFTSTALFAASTGCEDCGYGMYSPDGRECLVCAPGFQPDFVPAEGRSTGCRQCVDQYSADGKECFDCALGERPTLGFAAPGCVACRTFGDSIIGTDRVSCSACGVGKESTGVMLRRCGACKWVHQSYCSKECQVAAWLARHRRRCAKEVKPPLKDPDAK